MIFEYKPRPGGLPLDPKRCKASVGHGDRSPVFMQCYRKVWKGGWCQQHHPDTVNDRRLAREQKWRAERRADEKRWAIDRAEAAVVRAAVRYVESAGKSVILRRAVKRLQRARKM